MSSTDARGSGTAKVSNDNSYDTLTEEQSPEKESATCAENSDNGAPLAEIFMLASEDFVDFAALIDQTITDITDAGVPPLPIPLVDGFADVFTEGMGEAERDHIRSQISALVNYRLTLFWLKRNNSARVA